jgi:hypothetical protein
MKDESFSFLGFVFRRTKTKQGKWGIMKTPKMEARTKLLRKLKEEFRRHRSQPLDRIIHLINPILRGWVNYYRIGNSARCFGYVNTLRDPAASQPCLLHKYGRDVELLSAGGFTKTFVLSTTRLITSVIFLNFPLFPLKSFFISIFPCTITLIMLL